MPFAEEIHEIAPGIFIWQVYDPAVKADLFSTAVETPAGMYLIDPVGLKQTIAAPLEARGKITGIVVTNENHERAARGLAERFSVPIYLHSEVRQALTPLEAVELNDNGTIAPGLTALAIEGAPAGEMALHYEMKGGTMIIGDALINFEPYGFALLPAKYCRDFKLMRRSLPRLLDYSFERMLFAHGTPILSRARERLDHLLAST